jgi:hypothetical protein
MLHAVQNVQWPATVLFILSLAEKSVLEKDETKKLKESLPVLRMVKKNQN